MRGPRGGLHGEPAAGRERAVFDRDGHEDAVRRAGVRAGPGRSTPPLAWAGGGQPRRRRGWRVAGINPAALAVNPWYRICTFSHQVNREWVGRAPAPAVRHRWEGGRDMRSLFLSLVLGAAALGLVGVTPSQAEARWFRGGRWSGYYYPSYSYGGYYPGYYGSYYYPSYGSYYYTPGYATYYMPGYGSYYYTPGYSYGYYPATSYYYYYYPGTTYYYWR